MSVESDRRATIIRCEGPAAANPTWRALQVLAVDVAVELAGGTPSTRWRPAGEAAFEVRVAWR